MSRVDAVRVLLCVLLTGNHIFDEVAVTGSVDDGEVELLENRQKHRPHTEPHEHHSAAARGSATGDLGHGVESAGQGAEIG